MNIMKYLNSERFSKHGCFRGQNIKDHMAWTKYLWLFWAWPNIKYLWHEPNVTMNICSLSSCGSSYNTEHALSASWDVPAVDCWLFESRELSVLNFDSFLNLNSRNLPGISHRAWLMYWTEKLGTLWASRRKQEMEDWALAPSRSWLLGT